MFLTHLIYALSIGLGIAWLFGFALGTRWPWNTLLRARRGTGGH